MRKPSARISCAPMPSNSACGSIARIARAKRRALASPDASPVEKKYLIERSATSLQNAAFRRFLEKRDDLAPGVRGRFGLHRFDRLRDVHLGVVKMFVELLDLVALVHRKTRAAQSDAVEPVGLRGIPLDQEKRGNVFG